MQIISSAGMDFGQWFNSKRHLTKTIHRPRKVPAVCVFWCLPIVDLKCVLKLT